MQQHLRATQCHMLITNRQCHAALLRSSNTILGNDGSSMEGTTPGCFAVLCNAPQPHNTPALSKLSQLREQGWVCTSWHNQAQDRTTQWLDQHYSVCHLQGEAHKHGGPTAAQEARDNNNSARACTRGQRHS